MPSLLMLNIPGRGKVFTMRGHYLLKELSGAASNVNSKDPVKTTDMITGIYLIDGI